MDKYWIDFSGYCEVEANSKEEAENKFWNGLHKPSNACKNYVYDIDLIEKRKEEE